MDEVARGIATAALTHFTFRQAARFYWVTLAK
jgi:hypothetical protein